MKKDSGLSFRAESSLFIKTEVCLLKASCWDSSLTQSHIVKYDPSKYCHNLRKLEPDLARAVPVSELSWRLEERGDSINTKRKGESPLMKKPPKKLRHLGSEALNGAVVLSSGCQSHSKATSSRQLDHRSKRKPKEKSKLPPSRSLNSKISGRGILRDESNVSGVTVQNNMSVSESDTDSEEEIRAMGEREREVQKAENGEAESDHLEIVGDNCELKYSSYRSLSNPDAMKQAIKGSFREKETMECDTGDQSAGTGEIIAESKTPHLRSRNSTVLEDFKQVKMENEELLTEKKSDLVNDSSVKTHNLKEYVEKKGKKKKSQTAALQSTAGNSTTKTSDSESSCSEPEKGESEISSDYESMTQNCYRLDLTLDDLQALAIGTRGAELDSTQSSSQRSVEAYPKGNVANKTKLSKFCPAVRKKCICPEDVVAAILVGEEDADEASSKGQNNLRLKYQPFRGMGTLCEKELPRDSTGLEKGSGERLDLGACVSSCGEESSQRQWKNHPMYSLELSSKKRQNTRCEPLEELSDATSFADERGQPGSRPHLQGKNKDASSMQDKQNSEHADAAPCTDESEDESSDMDSNAAVSQKHAKRQLKSPKLLSKQLKLDVSNQRPECEADKREDGKRSLLENQELCLHATASKEHRPKKKQLQDNQKRLSSFWRERHREGERERERVTEAAHSRSFLQAGNDTHNFSPNSMP
uniref:Uncharacterized protein n=2 Tax=Strigops habroptila TaxID=2489341 RepID=A0A672UDB2_STRHB